MSDVWEVEPDPGGERRVWFVKIGAILPQQEIPTDVGALREWVSGVEHLGFDHVVMYDHVLGADPGVHSGWSGPYDVDTTFHEVFVTLGFIAAMSSLELATGVLVLPQRQAAVVAKQAAELAILSGGRFRLGVGVGWNEVEMSGLGQTFGDRGRRMTEQIEVMRRLWCERSVSIAGQHHVIRGAGLAPRPEQPVLVWIGARAPAALQRVGRIADGWFAPHGLTEAGYTAAREMIDRAAEAAGRDPSDVAMEGRVSARASDLDQLVESVGTWKRRGASHVSVATLQDGLCSVDAHLTRLHAVAERLGLNVT